MERVKALIAKLQQQTEQGADAAALLFTVQLLQSELQLITAVAGNRLGTAKVVVVLPASNNIKAAPTTAEKKLPEVVPVIKEPLPASTPLPVFANQIIASEVPTLAHQTNGKEINDVIGRSDASLNDRLKTATTEVAHKLTTTPIKDLKKAIGINDRFVFMSELFKNDEVMYERSLKTINNFTVYEEAAYWMDRELKLKLAWDDSKELVQEFYQLVRRRFS
jgi:hypothetical protein